ncbi:uncharacterized protein VTP21DRAFT_6407 [Calcarisporiella thermophila]|uniref:uncharacterized protein n=1 Tax=Calcarisporiella thermophila TaxID=911321 RepID=UPI003743DD0E
MFRSIASALEVRLTGSNRSLAEIGQRPASPSSHGDRTPSPPIWRLSIQLQRHIGHTINSPLQFVFLQQIPISEFTNTFWKKNSKSRYKSISDQKKKK